MAIRLPRIVSSKKVPKGYFQVYVGENQKRFVIPVSFLNHPSFQDLLGMSQEEFGYSHPTGGLTIPCNEDTFLKGADISLPKWKTKDGDYCNTPINS
ncbi:hypothetical protein Godav_014574, partial [Gossypium davidsonii]|nr:hypothetical protein [Gossypium davidsonii]